MTTKGLTFQLAMALCNAPRDASAFCATPPVPSTYMLTRAPGLYLDCQAFVTTRTRAGVDLPGIRRDMSDDDTASSPAARGGAGARDHHSEARRDDHDSSRA
jgi:hypothetical protein